MTVRCTVGEEAIHSGGVRFNTLISQAVMMSLVQTFSLFLDVVFLLVFVIKLVFIKTNTVPLSPLQSLVVANGGLGNGVSREELSAALKEMGELEALIMHPHKPYAFVTYRYGCCTDSTISHLSATFCFETHTDITVILFPDLKSVLGKPTPTSMGKSCNVETALSHSTSVMSTQVLA